MTRFVDLSETEQGRFEAAAAWRLRIQTEPALRRSPEFEAWVANPDNREALGLVSEGLDLVAQFGAAPELLALRQATLKRARRVGAVRWLPIKRAAVALAAALLVAAVMGGGSYWYLQQPATYETQIGERRAIALADGSRISLDSNTEVKVRYTKSARILELLRGRARFDVAHDITRPFSVNAGSETVVAVGTSFDVERLGPKVLVTLIQGHVIIKSDAVPEKINPMPRHAIVLSPGEQMVAAVDSKPVISPTDIQTAKAWETGQLVFHNETLAEAVEQVNRYSPRPVSLDPAIASVRVTGVFNAGDVNSFVTAVTSYLPIVASTTADNQILLQPRT